MKYRLEGSSIKKWDEFHRCWSLRSSFLNHHSAVACLLRLGEHAAEIEGLSQHVLKDAETEAENIAREATANLAVIRRAMTA